MQLDIQEQVSYLANQAATYDYHNDYNKFTRLCMYVCNKETFLCMQKYVYYNGM